MQFCCLSDLNSHRCPNFYGFFTLFSSKLRYAVLTNDAKNQTIFYEGDVMSSVYLGLTVIFFAVTVVLVYACEKIRGQS
jgi:hypothetical protein